MDRLVPVLLNGFIKRVIYERIDFQILIETAV